MQAISKYYEDGMADLEAFLAGNDILLFSKNIPKGIALIKEAISTGTIKEEEINKRVIKILNLKEWLSLDKQRIVSSCTMEDINSYEAKKLKRTLYRNAITLVKNDDRLIPLNKYQDVSCVQIGGMESSVFSKYLFENGFEDLHFIAYDSDEYDQVFEKMGHSKIVVVGIFSMNKLSSKDFGLNKNHIEFLKTLRLAGQKICLVIFGSPYSLKFFNNEDAILVAYDEDEDAQEAAVDALTGRLKPKGFLPVTASDKFVEGIRVP